MFLGRFRLGDWLPLNVRTVVPSTSVPTMPSSPVAVTAVIWSASSLIEGVRLPVKGRYAITGHFGRDLQLGSRYTTGQHFIYYSWNAGGEPGLEIDTFEIVAGGDADGAIISCYEMQGPEARFIIQELDSGPIVIGRNAR